MKTRALFLSLLLSLGTASAKTPLYNIELSDGRKCEKCTYETKQGYVVSVKDAKGDNWIDPEKVMTIRVIKAGFLSWDAKTYKTPAQGVEIQFGGSVPSPPASYGPSFGKVLLQGIAAGAGAYANTPRPIYVQSAPPVIRPTYTAPTHTTCQTFYGTTNCNSY